MKSKKQLQALFLLVTAADAFVVPSPLVSGRIKTRQPLKTANPVNQEDVMKGATVTTAADPSTPASVYDGLLEDDNPNFPFVWTRQWYPLMPLELLKPLEVEEKGANPQPKQITVLGRKLVIWNNGNENSNEAWTVMEDVCPHRRAPLSTGKVLSMGDDSSTSGSSSNTIMCRFHGWEFDASGSCTKIPMQPTDSKMDATGTKATKATALPTQVKGGLLWAFLDETVEPDQIPPLSPEAYVEGDGSHMQYSYTVFPVSYLGMVENSFDPSHAPFIHEGISEFGGRVFSPEGAVPMQQYNLVEGTTSTIQGFSMDHTPYTNQPGNPITTRSFIPPCTQTTKAAFFAAHLYFIPSTPQETIVIFSFPRMPQKKNKLWIRNALASAIPASLRSRVGKIRDDFDHFASITSNRQQRFYLQDTVTMQGQDYNKQQLLSSNSKSDVVMDMVPTPSDQGVSVFQRWIKRFAGQGPFGSQSYSSNSLNPNDNSSYQPTLSHWDQHMKYCPSCQRCLRRLSSWADLSQKVSKGLMGACAALGVVSVLLAQKRLLLLQLMYGGLLLAVALKSVAGKWRKQVEEAFITHANAHHPKNDLLLDLYAK